MMNTHRSVSVLVFLVFCFWSGFEAKAGLHEGLAKKLRTHNFNLYSAPFLANDMALRDMKGRVVSLSEAKGKVIFLNFWRIDCPPCSLEKPILEKVFRKYSQRGLEILAVNLFDPVERQLTYVRGNGFSFTFAFDPRNNLCIKKEEVGSRIPSHFVINANSEAIYEIPGVPTTYVIDRQGRIIGNCVGLINWEASPFTEFLESLLGESPLHTAHEEGFFETAAKQGTVVTSGNEHLVGALYAQADPGVPSDRTVSAEQPSLKLPFQAPASPDIARDKTTPASLTPGKEGTKQIGEAATRDKKQKETGRGSQTKQSQTLQTSSPRGKQQPFQGKKKGSDDSRSAAPVGVKQIQPETTPSDPFGLSSFLPSGSSGTTGSKALPPLPPALPYTPPRSSDPSGNRSLVPDQTGGVMARIPSSVGTSTSGSISAPGRHGQTAGLPSARPLGMQNPIDGFILDSFGRGGNLQPALIRPEPTGSPSPSMLGQIKQDIKQLGSGVKETFSRFLPGF